MAGIIATLKKGNPEVPETYREYPGGYIDLPNYRCDLTESSPQFPTGKITFVVRYYLSKSDYDANQDDFVELNINPIPNIELPYVEGSDPVLAALVQLQEWFPDAVVVK